MPVLSTPISARAVSISASDVGTRQAQAAADVLFAAGAIATFVDEPRPILIGDMRWLSDGRVLLFAAFGDQPADAHLLRYDAAMVNESGSVVFLSDEHVAGSLHRIEDADVEDTDDYRIAWQLWQDVEPLRRGAIERCYRAAQEFRPN